jgi:hypothetical protein
VTLATAALGWLLLAAALAARSRTAASLGLAALWTATVFLALAGGAVETVGVSLGAAVLSWDAAGRALALGRQLTTAASTARVEAVHALATVAVGLGSLGVAYAVFAVSSWRLAAVAVVAVGLALALFVAALESP